VGTSEGEMLFPRVSAVFNGKSQFFLLMASEFFEIHFAKEVHPSGFCGSYYF